MKKFFIFLLIFLFFILTGCEGKVRPNSIPDDTLVQVTCKFDTYVKELEIYVPEKGRYYDISVTKSVYNRVETGSWVELGDLKEKVNLDE